MNRYKVVIRGEVTLVVEAHSASGAEEKAQRLAFWETGCLEGMRTCGVESVTNLSDPIELVTDLACELERYAYKDRRCKFCGSIRIKHAEDCVLERARYFLNEAD